MADDVPMDRSYTEEMPLTSISSECCQTATSIADDVPMDRSYTEELPLSSISSKCYQTATSMADDVLLDRSYTEELPLSSISSECYQTKDTLEHLPGQDSGLEVFDDVHLGRSDYDEMQSPSPDRHGNNDNSVQDMESQSNPSKCDLPKDTPQNLQGKLENRYLDTGTICSLLVENKSGLPKFLVG